jgi:PilZ domain
MAGRFRPAVPVGDLENISVGGLGLLVDHPVPTGKVVAISYGEGGLPAVVRHCQPTAERYRIGFEFVGNSQELSLQAQPELLFWPV